MEFKNLMYLGLVVGLLSFGGVVNSDCITPTDDLYVTSNITLCSGTYNIIDNDANGVIIIAAPNIIVNCNGTTLNGTYIYGSAGVYNDHYDNVILKNCNINNYWYGIHLYFSDHNTINNNTVISNNAANIFLQYSNYNILSDNTVNRSHLTGIRLDNSNYNNISNNVVDSTPMQEYGYTQDEGIRMALSNFNHLVNNTISNSELGIEIASSNDNLIYHNNFINNINLNAYDNSGSNSWDNGSEGNYWSDYTGEDANGDGIGDSPYEIYGSVSIKDNYPFIEKNGWITTSTSTTSTTTTTSTSTTSTTLFHPADTNHNGKIDDFELLNYIDLWVQGLVSDFNLLEAIDNWAS